MHFIGIDMSKDTFHVAFDDQTVKVFPNISSGVATFIETLILTGAKKETTTIGVEATGVYHLLLAETLRCKGWCLKVINPLITSRMIKTNSLRRVKTDRTDALAIRKCLLTGAGYEYTDTPEILALKALVQERQTLCGLRATLKQRQHAHSYKARVTKLKLHDSFSKTIITITKEITVLEKKMDNYAKPTQQLLRTIPGVGKTSAAALVAYVSDINRFASAKKLTAYIGIDCRVQQSGTSIHGKGYISKRGNSYLRTLLFNAAFIAQRRNPILRAYFEKKKKEGKHYFSALCAVERKLIHLIYGVWKRETPFEAKWNQPNTTKSS